MPTDVYMMDRVRIAVQDARISPLGAAPMFASGVIDRFRAFRGQGGQMRMIGLFQHLQRCRATAELLFGSSAADLTDAWKDQLASVALATGLDQVYLHLGYGQMESSGTMLRRASTGLQTFVFGRYEDPLYQGCHGDVVFLSTETEWPRPDGPLVKHKTHAYAELLHLKNRARARVPDKDPRSVEALLLSRCSFIYNQIREAWVVDDEDPLVAECGCSCAFALDREGNLHLPVQFVQYFRGITVRIVEALFRAYFPAKSVFHDLRKGHMLFNGGTAGTAGGVVPVVEIDGQECIRTEQLETLAGLYRALCYGELNNRRLQEEWAPVVCRPLAAPESLDYAAK